jgi:hypothetical protein
MAIPVTVQPYSQASDVSVRFKSPAQQEVLRRFQAGAHLHVWRCTCPDNWWVADPDGENETHISGKDFESADQFPFGTVSSLRFLGKPAGQSASVITRSLNQRDIGKSDSEWWVYDAEKAARLMKDWDAFLAARAAWLEAVLPLAPDFAALSPRALSLVRTLKSSGVWPYPELADEFEELRLQGLLDYNKSGLMVLRPEVRAMRVARGQSLALKNPKSLNRSF